MFGANPGNANSRARLHPTALDGPRGSCVWFTRGFSCNSVEPHNVRVSAATAHEYTVTQASRGVAPWMSPATRDPTTRATTTTLMVSPTGTGAVLSVAPLAPVARATESNPGAIASGEHPTFIWPSGWLTSGSQPRRHLSHLTGCKRLLAGRPTQTSKRRRSPPGFVAVPPAV
jgi:hypothetical protein